MCSYITDQYWYCFYFEYFIDNLAGVKILHGIDKVVEGGAVVLTLKIFNWNYYNLLRD